MHNRKFRGSRQGLVQKLSDTTEDPESFHLFIQTLHLLNAVALCPWVSWSQDGCYSFRHHHQVQTPGEKWGETMSGGLFLMCLSPVTSEENLLRRTLCLLSQKGTTWPPLATRQTAKCFQYQGKGNKLPMLGFNRPWVITWDWALCVPNQSQGFLSKQRNRSGKAISSVCHHWYLLNTSLVDIVLNIRDELKRWRLSPHPWSSQSVIPPSQPSIWSVEAPSQFN